LKHYSSSPGQAEKLLAPDSKYLPLLSSFFLPANERIASWVNAPYESNQKYPEKLIHKSSSGHFVRSKSEEMIATLLFMHGIPFRYECFLTLNGISLFPDFTILHPKTEKLFYWEHFGLMDDTSYSKTALSKLQLYISHGIIPSIQLITTFETKNSPLSSDMIRELINYYFLS